MYIPAFVLPYCNTVLVNFFIVRAMFLTKSLEAKNLRSSSNERDVTKVQDSETKLKTLLIYIKKKISEVGDPCEILISIFLSLFLYSSITI